MLGRIWVKAFGSVHLGVRAVMTRCFVETDSPACLTCGVGYVGQESLAAADTSMQELVAQREAALRSKVEGDMKTATDDMVDKVCSLLLAPCARVKRRPCYCTLMCWVRG